MLGAALPGRLWLIAGSGATLCNGSFLDNLALFFGSGIQGDADTQP